MDGTFLGRLDSSIISSLASSLASSFDVDASYGYTGHMYQAHKSHTAQTSPTTPMPLRPRPPHQATHRSPTSRSQSPQDTTRRKCYTSMLSTKLVARLGG